MGAKVAVGCITNNVLVADVPITTVQVKKIQSAEYNYSTLSAPLHHSPCKRKSPIFNIGNG